MKKGIIAFACAVLLFTGCDKTKKIEENNPPEQTVTEPPVENKEIQGTVSEYFPLKENTIYVYSGDENSYGYDSYVIYKEGSKVQRRSKTSITTSSATTDFISTEVFEITGDAVNFVYADSESNGFENFLERQEDEITTILKEPLQLGNSWERSFISNSSRTNEFTGKSTITAVEVPIDTPAGEFECIEVTSEFELDYKIVEYYAKGIGLVKSNHVSYKKEEGKEPVKIIVETLLSEIKEDAPLEVSLKVYYPDEMATDTVTEDIKFEFNTNDNMKEIFEKVLKNPSENIKSPVISENTKINGISVDREASEVHVDFSKEFKDEMNAGSGYETLILNSIADTFCNFYNTYSFYLTVEGEEYVSGH